MFCPKCGNPCGDYDPMCRYCGTVFQTEVREDTKTRNLKFVLAGIISACLVLVVMAFVVAITLIASKPENNVTANPEKSVVTDANSVNESVNSVSEPTDPDSESAYVAQVEDSSSTDGQVTDVSPVPQRETESSDVSVSENEVSVKEVSEPSPSHEESKTLSREEQYRRLKIPGNTWSFVRSFSDLKQYTVADLDGDDEFELITVSKNYTVTLYNYDWDADTYEKTGSMKAEIPDTSQGDQVVFGMIDDQFCVRFYDFSSSSDSTASVRDTLCDVLTMRVNSSKDVGVTQRGRIWYDHLPPKEEYKSAYNPNLSEIIDEVIMFDASYEYTSDLVLPDLQTRYLTEDLLKELMVAHGKETKQEKLDFLSEIENETAGLKGYIFQRGGENYQKFMSHEWYRTKYYTAFEKELTGNESEDEENSKRENYNYRHYWNGDKDKPSPLSQTYDDHNREIIEKLRGKIKES